MLKSIITLVLCIFVFHGETYGAEFTDLKANDLRGCVGISKDGVLMGCISFTGGRSHLEIKEINTRRLRRIFLLGSKETPLDATSTPPRDLKKALKGSMEYGLIPLLSAPQNEKGHFEVPLTSCSLTLRKDNAYVETVAPDGVRPWLKRDGLKGEDGTRGPTELLGVSVSKEHRLIFIVLRHQTVELDTAIPEIKVLRLEDLLHRGECARKEPSENKKSPPE